MEDKLLFMWIIKNQLDFNMPYFILNYLVECVKWIDIGFILYGLTLTPFLLRVKIKLNEES